MSQTAVLSHFRPNFFNLYGPRVLSLGSCAAWRRPETPPTLLHPIWFQSVRWLAHAAVNNAE